jgi:hypothetical protein
MLDPRWFRATAHASTFAGTVAAAMPASLLSIAKPASATILALATVLVAATGALAATPDSVFHVDRNKNRNQVHYGVRVDENCRPVGDEPVFNYWLRREKDPPAVEPLRFYQQAGYGFEKQKVEDDYRIEVRLRALPERQLVIRLASVNRRCKAETFMTISGKQAYLEKVFVFADEGFVLPTIRYIELFGHSNDGKSVYEKISVNE